MSDTDTRGAAFVRRRIAAPRHAAILCATAMATTLFAGQASAQSAGGAGKATSDDTIIVTAQRRSEALQDVPMSVSVVNQSTIANVGINTVGDLSNVTSGFQLNNSGSYPQPAIRGVTTTNSGSYENNVALFVDGLYEITPQILNMDLPNVESIQILKGPQGTLYGRNATGGAILIDTIDPKDYWEGMAELTYARFDDKRARGYVAGPLSDKIGMSLSGTIRRTDGYYKWASQTSPLTQTDGHALGLKQESLRAKMKFDLTDSFRATIGYNYTRASDPRGVYFSPNENTATPYPRGVVAGNFFDLDFKQHEALLKLELDVGPGTLRSVSGYAKSDLSTTYDSGGTYTPDRAADSKLVDHTIQTNLDYDIKAGMLDLILGGNYFKNKEKYAPGRANASYVAGPGATISSGLGDYLLTSQSDSHRTKEAWALFFDATMHLADKISLTLGGRYSKEHQTTHAVKTTYAGSLSSPTGVVYDATLPKTYKLFTPRASIRYEISPQTSVYASYTKGFKAGETNSVIPGDNPATWDALGEIGQETVNAYEIGFKHADRKLRVDLAGFYYDYKDLQISSVQFVGGVASVLLQNLPKAKIYGAEASIDYEVTPNFKVRAGATWLHARYGAGAVYVGTGGSDIPLTTAFSDPLKNNLNRAFPFGPRPGPMAQDLTGMQMARAPNFTGYIGFDYKIPQGDGGFTFSANVKYTSSYVVTDPSIWGGELLSAYKARLATDPTAMPNNAAGLAGTPYADRSNEQRARQGAYAMVNGSITWADPSDSYYIRVWGKNLTDRTIAAHYRPSSSTYIPIQEPRTYGVTVGYKFD